LEEIHDLQSGARSRRSLEHHRTGRVPDAALRPARVRACLQVFAGMMTLRAWFKRRLHLGVAGVDARRATPPDPRLPRWGLAGCRQLDPSHPALVTCEDAEVEPCRIFGAPAGVSCFFRG